MPVLGVLLLEADHSVETVGLADPFSWRPPAGLGRGFFGHPDHWPVPTVFAVARGATGATSAAGTDEAVAGVVEAIGRLEGRCDLILGGCGYFGDAWAHLPARPAAYTVLSALDQLDAVLAATALDVVVMSASTQAGLRAVAQHPGRDRIRVVGLDGVGEWARFARPDWAEAGLISDAGIADGLRRTLARHAVPGGLLDGIGAIVLECTVLPHHRAVIREFSTVPIIDAEQLILAAL